jgi:signal peptidase I
VVQPLGGVIERVIIMKLKTWITLSIIGFSFFILNQFSIIPFVAVPTVSMEPVFHRGELILTKRVNTKDIQIGDIIVVAIPNTIQEKYQYPSSMVHRVTEISESTSGQSYFKTRGDNNPSEDPFKTNGKNVQGKVYWHTSKLGYPILFLHSIQGKISIVVIISLLIFDSLYQSFQRNRKKLNQYIISTFQAEIRNEFNGLRSDLQVIQQHLQTVSDKRNEETNENE